MDTGLQSAPESTKGALLDAAERLFAEAGVDATSLRAITQAAGANLASVNYHFGSKEGLVRAVLARRIGPLNRERIARLEQSERDGASPALDQVVRAFVAPTLEMVRSEAGGPAFARFVVRAFTEPNPALRSMLEEQFREVVARFTAVLARCLPELPAEDVHWRFHFMVGAMVHTVGLGSIAHRYSDGICDPLDVEGVADRLVAFLTGGLRQPPTGEGS